jgi:RNA recognition motif-containing protein
LYQKFLKTSIGEKAIHALEEVEEKLASSSKSAASIRSPSLRVSSAGEQQFVKSQAVGERTFVEEVRNPEIPPTPHIPKPEEESVTANDASVIVVSGAVEPTIDQSKNTLVIKNLPFKFKPAELDKLLSDHQAHPKNVRLLRDNEGRFTGMAFIRCPSKEEAQRLIGSMNGLDISGRNIQVEFKMKKKKKNKLATSTDSVSSLNSSSDEMPIASKLRTSGEYVSDMYFRAPDTQVVTPVVVESTAASGAPLHNLVSVNNDDVAAPSAERRTRKLAVSAENTTTSVLRGNGGEERFKKPPQIRRKSTSVLDSIYTHSALSRNYLSGPTIRPVRQPAGPDGKTIGFSEEYKRSRVVTTQH